MTTTPHHVGQVAKAELTAAHVIDSAPTGATPEQVAAKIVEQLQNLGWAPPRDLTEQVPLRPEKPGDLDGPGRREFHAARAALAARPRDTSTR